MPLTKLEGSVVSWMALHTPLAVFCDPEAHQIMSAETDSAHAGYEKATIKRADSNDDLCFVSSIAPDP